MRTYNIKAVHMVRLEEGTEIISELKKACNNMKGGIIKGIGGLDKAKIAVFNPEKGEYDVREVIGFHEIASLSGNLSVKKDGEKFLHLHVVLGSWRGVIAGHLIEGYVRGTAEIAIFELDEELNRTIEARGLTLLDL
ncbi:MAG: PPC domain-containing DNA-binding protein [Candidatus Methanodesulfokora sp.]|jgi:predicted DNA-binding protein with PD1-like motif